MSDSCPACSGRGKVVTSVTVAALGTEPRTVIVTRQCTVGDCHLKYPVLKSETDLTEEERRLWRNP